MIMVMDQDWRKRLEMSVINSGLSKSAISSQAGLDATYLRDVFNKRRTTPSIEKLIQICEVINESPSYILTGIRLDKRAERMLEQFATLPDDKKQLAIELLESFDRTDAA